MAIALLKITLLVLFTVHDAYTGWAICSLTLCSYILVIVSINVY